VSAPAFVPPILAPSILSADFTRLDREVAIVDPARDWIHCDVMDHHFVPNLTFGPMVVEAVRRLSTAFLDVHLMTERPWDLAESFRNAGADQITIHLEAWMPNASCVRSAKFARPDHESGSRSSPRRPSMRSCRF
jgi:ribulose-phosphate 3-epimerase